MGILGSSSLDAVRREAEEANRSEEVTKKKGEVGGIFGLAKNGSETTQCLSSTIKVSIDLENLNREIEENGKDDFYKAFLKENMFQKIRTEITDYQGR